MSISIIIKKPSDCSKILVKNLSILWILNRKVLGQGKPICSSFTLSSVPGECNQIIYSGLTKGKPWSRVFHAYSPGSHYFSFLNFSDHFLSNKNHGWLLYSNTANFHAVTFPYSSIFLLIFNTILNYKVGMTLKSICCCLCYGSHVHIQLHLITSTFRSQFTIMPLQILSHQRQLI